MKKKFYEDLIDCQKPCYLKDNFGRVLNKCKKLQNLNRQNEEIFFQILHDIKSPALGIKFALEKTSRCELEEEIYNINSYVLELIQSFLTVYSFKSGHGNLIFETFSLGDIVARQIQTHKYMCKSKNIKMTFVNLAKTDEINSDKSIVSRIIANLIANALKYSPGGSEVSVKINNKQNHTSVAVCNESEEQINASSFKKFNTNGGSGSFGLGLYICKRLSRKINSKLQLNYKDGYVIFELIIPGE